MLRRLSTLVSAVSLMLCVATCALWVRSYWVGDAVELEMFRDVPQPVVGRNYFSYGVTTGLGGIGYVVREGVFGMPPDVLRAKQAALAAGPVWSHRQVAPRYPYRKPDNPPSLLNRLGIYYESVRWGHAGNVDAVTAVTVPTWMLAVAAGLLAVTLVARLARR